MLTELYHAGDSWWHRCRPGVKLLALTLFASVLLFNAHWPVLLAGGALLLGLSRQAGIPLTLLWQNLAPLRWMLLAIFVLHTWLHGWVPALFVVLRLATLVAAAALVTLSTRASDMLDALEQALRYILPARRAEQISLALSLCLRFIPRLRRIFDEVHDAQRARGLGRDWRALLIPTLLRALQAADDIAQAIHARAAQANTDAHER